MPLNSRQILSLLCFSSSLRHSPILLRLLPSFHATHTEQSPSRAASTPHKITWKATSQSFVLRFIMAGPSQSLSPGKKRPAPGSLKSEDKRVRLDDIALPNFAGSTSRDGDVQSPGTLNTLMAKQEAIQHGLEAASKIAAIINESSASKLPPQIANIREDLGGSFLFHFSPECS